MNATTTGNVFDLLEQGRDCGSESHGRIEATEAEAAAAAEIRDSNAALYGRCEEFARGHA